MDGQQKIREMWKRQVELQRKAERERLRAERKNKEVVTEVQDSDNDIKNTEDNQLEQQMILNGNRIYFSLKIFIILMITFQQHQKDLYITMNTK